MNIKTKKIILVVLLIVILASILYFGLKSHGSFLFNNIEANGKDGLIISNYSIIFTESGILPNFPEKDCFSISISFKAESLTEKRFQFIMVVTDGNPQKQFLVGQYLDTLVIMNGTDYGNYKREPKIYLKMDESAEEILLEIESAHNNINISFNGKSVKKSESIGFSLPLDTNKARLILGNSPSGRNPWAGTIKNIEIFNFGETNPVLAYSFNSTIRNNQILPSSGNYPLVIPEMIKELYPVYLQFPGAEILFSKNLQRDVIINLIGFIPLGLILTPGWYLFTKRKYGFLIVVFISFGTSFFIEISQVLIPGRNSSSLDLLLNTAGGCLGYLLFNTYSKIREHFESLKAG